MNESSLLPAHKLACLTDIPTGFSLITGPRGVGKTSWCEALNSRAMELGLTTGGILCPALIENETKTGIQIIDIQTGERRLLGSRYPDSELNLQVGENRYFDLRALQWGNEILQRTSGIDLTIIDELGLLEFEQGSGFGAGLQLLDQRRYQSACVVVRPKFLAYARQRWPEGRIIRLSDGAA